MSLHALPAVRDRNDVSRRICIHREIDNIADACHDGTVSMRMVRALAQDLGEAHGDDPQTERAVMLTLAGYMQAVIENSDRAAAR